jgi:hypothetical protein
MNDLKVYSYVFSLINKWVITSIDGDKLMLYVMNTFKYRKRR